MKQSILAYITGIIILLAIFLFPKIAIAETTQFHSAQTVTTDGYVAYTNLSNCTQTDGFTCDRATANLWGNLYFQGFGNYDDYGIPQDAKITRVKARTTGKSNVGLYLGFFRGSSPCWTTPSDLMTLWYLMSSTITTQTFNIPVTDVWQPGTISSYCVHPSNIQSTFWRINHSSSQLWHANIDNLEVAFDYEILSTPTPTITPTSTPTPTPTKLPLILIPGAMGSKFSVTGSDPINPIQKEKYDSGTDSCVQSADSWSYNQNDLIWINEDKNLPNLFDFINKSASSCTNYLDILRLQSDGSTAVYPQVGLNGDVTDTPYKDTVTYLTDSHGYIVEPNNGENLFIFPYDWRKDIAFNADLLDQKVNEVLNKYPAGTKVQILAHSMGGLVSREYIRNIDQAQKVDTLIELGTPNVGTPVFLAHLLYNKCAIELPWINCIINGYEVNKLVQNFPGAFEVLPSKKYYQLYADQKDYPFNDQRDIDANGTKGELNYDQLKTLLANLNKNMGIFNIAESFHDSLDPGFTNTNGVKTYLIAGSGIPTIGQIRDYLTNILMLGGNAGTNQPHPEQDATVIDGDGTVPVKSATLGQTENVFYVNQEHTDLPKNQSLVMAVNLLKGKTDLINGVQKQPFPFNGKIIGIYSPAKLHAYDESGNHVGLDSDGIVEVNIPGATYDELGGEQFIYLPDGPQYRITTKATDVGSFDLKIKSYENSELTKESLYLNIDQTMQTVTSMSLDSETPVLAVDRNGDGITDQDLQATSTLTGNGLTDFIPPATVIEALGSQGSDGWYRSNVELKLSAEDNSSGILKTEYSFDDGKTVQTYTNPISVDAEGITKIKYHSIDQAGNEEEPKGFEVKIDKTLPEISVQFNPSTKLLEATGIDSGSGIESVAQTDNGITVQDKAGNITRLDITSEKINNDKAGKQEIVVNSLKYNDQPSVIPQTSLKVEWNADTDNSLNHLVQNFEISGTEKIVTVYNENKDKSTVITKTVGQNSEKSTTLGLKIIKLVSDKGRLILEI